MQQYTVYDSMRSILPDKANSCLSKKLPLVLIICISRVYAYISSICSAMGKNIEEMSKSGIWIFRGVAVILFAS